MSRWYNVRTSIVSSLSIAITRFRSARANLQVILLKEMHFKRINSAFSVFQIICTPQLLVMQESSANQIFFQLVTIGLLRPKRHYSRFHVVRSAIFCLVASRDINKQTNSMQLDATRLDFPGFREFLSFRDLNNKRHLVTRLVL